MTEKTNTNPLRRVFYCPKFAPRVIPEKLERLASLAQTNHKASLKVTIWQSLQ